MQVRILNSDPMLDYRQFCKITQGEFITENRLKPKDGIEFWVKHITACHSTIRCIHFRIIDRIPRSVAMQLVRHTDGHPQPEVESSRPDWTGKPRSNDPHELKWVAIDFTPESWIKMCQKRLCFKTERETRRTVLRWKSELEDTGIPLLVALSLCSNEKCQYLQGCNERQSCGYYGDIDNLAEKFYNGKKDGV